jgi:hypothetical protein
MHRKTWAQLGRGGVSTCTYCVNKQQHAHLKPLVRHHYRRPLLRPPPHMPTPVNPFHAANSERLTPIRHGKPNQLLLMTRRLYSPSQASPPLGQPLLRYEPTRQPNGTRRPRLCLLVECNSFPVHRSKRSQIANLAAVVVISYQHLRSRLRTVPRRPQRRNRRCRGPRRRGGVIWGFPGRGCIAGWLGVGIQLHPALHR